MMSSFIPQPLRVVLILMSLMFLIICLLSFLANLTHRGVFIKWWLGLGTLKAKLYIALTTISSYITKISTSGPLKKHNTYYILLMLKIAWATTRCLIPIVFYHTEVLNNNICLFIIYFASVPIKSVQRWIC